MLGRFEIVKEVSGTIGPNSLLPDLVTSLSFVTNITTYGPFGEEEGIPFRSIANENDKIVGFFARAEKHINGIGFYMAPINNQVSFILRISSVYFLLKNYSLGFLLIRLHSSFFTEI
jgi:hypothetical protein